jgi:cell division protein FtsA
MKTEKLCFVDFGFTHVSLAICNIVNDKLIDIPFLESIKIETPLQRYQSALTSGQNFEALLKIVDLAERSEHINISNIIFLLKDNTIKHSFLAQKLSFNETQKVSQSNMEKINVNMIGKFYTEYGQNYTITDFIKHHYQIDNKKFMKYPYKMKCKTLDLFASIFSVNKVSAKFFEDYLEKCKIHVKHYLSMPESVLSFLDTENEKGNFLFIDIGSGNTEFCVVHNGCIIMQNVINLGSIDITRDIATVLQISIDDADLIKKLLSCSNEEVFSKTVDKIGFLKKNNEVDIDNILQQAETIANARIKEILTYIVAKIDNKFKNFAFDGVFCLGRGSNYKNTVEIVGSIFNSKTSILLQKDISRHSIFNDVFGKYKQDTTVDLFKPRYLNLIGSIAFYINNIENYRNARRGFFYKAPKKIACFLKDLLY